MGRGRAFKNGASRLFDLQSSAKIFIAQEKELGKIPDKLGARPERRVFVSSKEKRLKGGEN